MVKMIGLAAALLASGLSIWVSASFKREPPPPPAESPDMTVGKGTIALTPEAPQWKVLRLDTAVTATSHWTDPVPARVKIDEAQSSKLGAPLAGRVITVSVELGQKVKVGDTLFTVASPNLAELRAEREKADVDLQVAKTSLERVQAMVATNALPAKEEVSARQTYRQAEVQVKLAAAKLSSLKVSSHGENEFTVAAPREGVIVEKNVFAGQEVSPDAGGALLAIADLSSVWVVADLFEADATEVREGALAEITSPSLPDVKLAGTVDMVSSVVDPNRHTVPIRVHLPNTDRLLKPNVYARVRFETKPREGAVEIPASALVSDGQHQYVFLQEHPGHFARHEIVAGSAIGGVVPILEGLKAGDTIVAEGAILLDNEIGLGE